MLVGPFPAVREQVFLALLLLVGLHLFLGPVVGHLEPLLAALLGLDPVQPASPFHYALVVVTADARGVECSKTLDGSEGVESLCEEVTGVD